MSRERIVCAALALADAEGLTAVSLRKVSASLDTGAMRLYAYLSTKDELLDLMVDAVYGEMAQEGPLPLRWDDALRTLADRTRQASKRHPWLVEILGGRPHQGPNALLYLESMLAALAGSGPTAIDLVLQAAKTFTAFMVGALRAEMSELRAESESGLTKHAWQVANQPYLLRQIETGQFPTIAKAVAESAEPLPDTVFAFGLECVIEGMGRHLNGIKPQDAKVAKKKAARPGSQ